MKKLLLISAAASLLATAAFAQTTVTTTTGTAGATVQIEPQYRTKIKSYVTEHKIRPVTTKEKIVVGKPIPQTVVLTPVPDSPKYAYAVVNEQRVIVDPQTRTVVQVVH